MRTGGAPALGNGKQEGEGWLNESSLLLVQSKRGVSGYCTPRERAEKEPMQIHLVQSFFSDCSVCFTDRDIYFGLSGKA